MSVLEIKLKENEACKYSDLCKWSKGCWGVKSDRGKEFTCTLFEPKPNTIINTNTPLVKDKDGKEILHG